SEPVCSPIDIICEINGGNAQCLRIGSVKEPPRSSESREDRMTLDMTALPTTFSVIVKHCRIGTELENSELNVRVKRANADFCKILPKIGIFRSCVSRIIVPCGFLRISQMTAAITTPPSSSKYQ